MEKTEEEEERIVRLEKRIERAERGWGADKKNI